MKKLLILSIFLSFNLAKSIMVVNEWQSDLHLRFIDIKLQNNETKSLTKSINTMKDEPGSAGIEINSKSLNNETYIFRHIKTGPLAFQAIGYVKIKTLGEVRSVEGILDSLQLKTQMTLEEFNNSKNVITITEDGKIKASWLN